MERKYEDNQEEPKGFAEEAAKVDVKVYEKELKHGRQFDDTTMVSNKYA